MVSGEWTLLGYVKDMTTCFVQKLKLDKAIGSFSMYMQPVCYWGNECHIHVRNCNNVSKMVSFTASTTKKPHAPSLGESRSHAVWRFLSLERSLHAKDEFEEIDSEYFDMKHAKPVPTADLEKPTCHILINFTLQEAFLRACSYFTRQKILGLNFSMS